MGEAFVMRGNATRFPDRQESKIAARARLKGLLGSARTLDNFTIASLAATHRLPLREIEYELTMARMRRVQEKSGR